MDNHHMPPIKRPHVMTVRLSDDELEFRHALVEHLGIDGSSVMRQGMLEFGRWLGFEFPLNKKKPRPKP